MKLTVIIGKACAGKSTFAQWLIKQTGEKAGRTSSIIYEAMAKARGCTVKDLEDLPKEELRPKLIALGDFMCDIQPDILSQALVQRGITVIDGVRRKSELEALREKHEIFVYYIRRDKFTVSDNFELDERDAHYIVDNNGEMNEFKILTTAERVLR